MLDEASEFIMTSQQRAEYWIDLEDELLVGGASFSEWCVFISKVSVR